MLYSEKERNSTAGPLVLRGDSSSVGHALKAPEATAVARRGAVLGNRLALGRTGGCNNTGRCARSFCPHPFGPTPVWQSRR